MLYTVIRYSGMGISLSGERYWAKFPWAINPYFNIHTEIINVRACRCGCVQFSPGDLYACARARAWCTGRSGRHDGVHVDSRSISRFGSHRATSPAELELICRRFIIQSRRHRTVIYHGNILERQRTGGVRTVRTNMRNCWSQPSLSHSHVLLLMLCRENLRENVLYPVSASSVLFHRLFYL